MLITVITVKLNALLVLTYSFHYQSETLYDFRVDIKQSSIENAGLGAFLTFLGARVLKPRAAARSVRLLKRHCVDDEICTHCSLDAVTVGGKAMNVTLTGENLHYNDNSLYWTKKRADKFEEFHSKNSQKGLVESFDENQIDCNVHKEVKKLREKIPDGKGIGFLGIHNESDYR